MSITSETAQQEVAPPEVTAVAETIAKLLPLVDQAAAVRKSDSAEALLFNYVLNNGKPKDRHLPSLLRLLRGTVEMGYHTWPLELKSLYQGKDVLHLGCGQSLHCVAFRGLGAHSYTGVDENLQLTRKKYRSKLAKVTVDLGLSLVDVTRLVPAVTFLRSDRIGLNEAFDLVVVPASTHRMLDLEGSFEQLHSTLRSRGQIWFMHENFYSWAGHQGDPKSPAAVDPNNPEHKKFLDWKHVRFDAPPDHPFHSLNRVRIGDLRRVVDRYFEVEQWKEIPDRASIVSRLTPTIRRSLRGFTEQDLLTKQVICRATKRSRG